jgi:predicted transposase YdaD
MGMTTADMLRAEGQAKGEAEGLAKGVAKGMARTLVRQLTRKFGPIPDTARQQIDAASIEQLEAWCDRLLDASTLDEVVA